MYRNYFKCEKSALNSEIAVICSVDSHYSMDKGANLLSIPIFKVEVDFDSRSISHESVLKTVSEAKSKGVKYFIVVSNMMTTMFGSVDNIDIYVNVLYLFSKDFKVENIELMIDEN